MQQVTTFNCGRVTLTLPNICKRNGTTIDIWPALNFPLL
jgi:hypothetical protein